MKNTNIIWKELLSDLCPKVGCRAPENLARAAKKHLKIEDFPRLSDLKKSLSASFNLEKSGIREVGAKNR